MNVKMNVRIGEFLVAFSTACRGSSLLFSKLAMQSMGPFMLMAWRFLIAFVILVAAILGVTILHEELTFGLVAGGILIVASTLAPVWLGKLMPENKGKDI